MSWRNRDTKGMKKKKGGEGGKNNNNNDMPPRRRKLTRSDYKELIGLKAGRGKRKKWGKRSVKGGGKTRSHLPEAMMLAHMMSKTNKNAKQRKAIIDSLNATQMRDVGHLVRGVLNVRRKLPEKQINQLIRDRKFIDAIVKGKGALSTRKKILSDQRGGFPGILFPLAAQLAAPVIGELGKLFK